MQSLTRIEDVPGPAGHLNSIVRKCPQTPSTLEGGGDLFPAIWVKVDDRCRSSTNTETLIQTIHADSND